LLLAGGLLLACALLLAGPRLEGAERLTLEVRETGGFRRQQCPSAVLLLLPAAVPRETSFRLLDDAGKPVRAQFRPAGENPAADGWWLDFGASLEPFAKRRYVVEYGPDVQAEEAPGGGHVLRETDDAFLVENAPYICWSVPRNLRGLLRSVDFPPNEHLRPDSPGLYLEDREGRRHPLGGEGALTRVTRSGPLCVALHCAGGFAAGPLSGVRYTADLTFPGPVSWVEVACAVEDPQQRVAALGLKLHMAIDAPTPQAPTLVDFGAWTYVYASLRAGETARMYAQPQGDATSLVRIERGSRGQQREVATNEAAAGKRAAEGWLQVMDRRRCLALAVADFGQASEDVLEVAAEGSVSYERHYQAAARGEAGPPKKLRGWLHFVHFPPQHSAATSPRMMQTPPEIRLVAGAGR
jgi:hypothetical protein